MFAHPKPAAALLTALMLAHGHALAVPGYYVVTPYDNEGLRIVDFRYWAVQANGGSETRWPELGLGYGVTSRWTTELYLSWIGSSTQATQPDTLNWQNDILLTQGQWPVDVAMHLQWVGASQNSHQRTLEFGPVLQTDVGRVQLNANLFFERPIGSQDSGDTQLQYQWQLRHRTTPSWQLGLQGFGEIGRWDQWAPQGQQSHRAGPAAFGTWHLTDHQTFKLQGAWLLGKTYGQRGHMFTAKAHIEF